MGGESIFIEFVLARYYYCFSGKLLICRVVKQDFIGKETGIVLSECRYSTVRVPSSLVCHGRGNFFPQPWRGNYIGIPTEQYLLVNRSIAVV